jgi:hypothetical protein
LRPRSPASAVSFLQNSTASSHDTFSTGKSLVSTGTLALPPAGCQPYFTPILPVPSFEKKLLPNDDVLLTRTASEILVVSVDKELLQKGDRTEWRLLNS